MTNEEIFQQYTGPAAIAEWNLRMRERELALQEAAEKRKQTASVGGMDFDSLNGVLRYGSTFHTFHNRKREDALRLELFKELWGNRKVIEDRTQKEKGLALPPATLALRINLIDSAQKFPPSDEAAFYSCLKGIQRFLRDKKFPARIERKNGIQLVIEL